MNTLHKNSDYELVSIIVTVYNKLKYINSCIDSLTKQTYNNIEILLIDDGSNDGSEKVCDNYAKKFKNISVVHKLNGGLVAARKTGAAAAKGKYIYFVDADDWIDPETIKLLVDSMANNSCDVAFTNTEYFDNNKIYHPYKEYCKNVIIENENLRNFKRKLLFDGTFFRFGASVNICGKLFIKSKYIEYQKSVDDRIKIGEDLCVTAPYIIDSTKITFYSNRYMYHYRQVETSMLNARINKNLFREEEILFNNLFGSLSKRGKEYIESIRYYFLSESIRIIKNYSRCSSLIEEKNIINDTYNLLHSYGAINNINFKTMNTKYQIFFYLLMHKRFYQLALLVKAYTRKK